MKSKKKLLIIILAAVLVLGAALTFLLLTGQEEAAPAEAGDSAVLLVPFTAETISEIFFENEEDSYTFVPAAAADGSASMTVREFAEYPVSSMHVGSAVNYLCALTGEILPDASASEEKYGLKTPASRVSFTAGEERRTLLAGAVNEAAGIRYIGIEGEDTVYTVPQAKASWLLRSRFYYIDTQFIEPFDRSKEKAVERLTGVKIERPDLSEPITIEVSGQENIPYASLYDMTSPLHLRTSQDIMENDLYALFGFSAAEAVGFHDEANDADCGFDEPSMIMTVSHDGVDEVFTVGSEYGGEGSGIRYLISDRQAFVYVIQETKLTFLKKNVEDIYFEMVLLPQIVDVSEVKLTVGGRTEDFRITHTSHDEDDRVTVVNEDGRTFTEEYFRDFYELMLEIDVQRLRTEEPVGEKLMEFVYIYSDGRDEDRIEVFATENEREMSISLNGEAQYAGRSAYIDKLLTELTHLYQDQPVDTNW